MAEGMFEMHTQVLVNNRGCVFWGKKVRISALAIILGGQFQIFENHSERQPLFQIQAHSVVLTSLA